MLFDFQNIVHGGKKYSTQVREPIYYSDVNNVPLDLTCILRVQMVQDNSSLYIFHGFMGSNITEVSKHHNPLKAEEIEHLSKSNKADKFLQGEAKTKQHRTEQNNPHLGCWKHTHC